MKDFNTFAEQEQPWQDGFRGWRDRNLLQIVQRLTQWGISANLLSGLGLLCLLPFAWIVLRDSGSASVATACFWIALHVLIDGLDGPLARSQGRGGLAGSFVDMCCDHAGAIIVLIVLIAAGLIHPLPGSLYVFTYTTSTFAIVLLNMIGRPFRWVVRTKYPLYALLLVYGLTGVNLLDLATGLFTAITGMQMFVGFRRVRKFLSQTDDRNRTRSLPAGNASATHDDPAVEASAADQSPDIDGSTISALRE